MLYMLEENSESIVPVSRGMCPTMSIMSNTHPLQKSILLPKINLYVPCRSAGSLSGPLRLPPQLAAATVMVYMSPSCALLRDRIEHV